MKPGVVGNRVECPICGGAGLVVKDIRPVTHNGFQTIRRRRECVNSHHFTTYEFAEEAFAAMRTAALGMVLREISDKLIARESK